MEVSKKIITNENIVDENVADENTIQNSLSKFLETTRNKKFLKNLIDLIKGAITDIDRKKYVDDFNEKFKERGGVLEWLSITKSKDQYMIVEAEFGFFGEDDIFSIIFEHIDEKCRGYHYFEASIKGLGDVAINFDGVKSNIIPMSEYRKRVSEKNQELFNDIVKFFVELATIKSPFNFSDDNLFEPKK